MHNWKMGVFCKGVFKDNGDWGYLVGSGKAATEKAEYKPQGLTHSRLPALLLI